MQMRVYITDIDFTEEDQDGDLYASATANLVTFDPIEVPSSLSATAIVPSWGRDRAVAEETRDRLFSVVRSLCDDMNERISA
mgnify:CR=1 FL=1